MARLRDRNEEWEELGTVMRHEYWSRRLTSLTADSQGPLLKNTIRTLSTRSEDHHGLDLCSSLQSITVEA